MWIVWLEKKILKTLGIILGIIIILITALHIYVVNNAETLVENIVASESKGKLKLKVKNIKFNYFSKKVELQDITFFSNDSLDLPTYYNFHVDKIKIKVKALIPIFTRKELKIDSLFLVAPKIEVTRLKPLDTAGQKDISIPREMGKVYNSIIDALKFLEVKRFQFDDGEFKLVNKVLPNQQPLIITRMHFHIETDPDTNAEDFLESDKLVFWTKGQDITFPDGNHRLAFSRFRIKIKKRLIEIDSCTLIGKRPDGSGSGFSLYLDTLKLTNVDFLSLYEKGLIKADSVYCLDPKFKIELELKNKTAGTKKIPNLDTLINQLTGDMQLNYVGVRNAEVSITTNRNDKSTSFTSEKNNFEMTGLRIDHSLPQPISLESFDMAIRNYENFVKDSSYFLRFDSIRLRENRILLSNFSINTEPYKDTRNIQVRQFILSELSWADLLFDQKVIARQALLIRPVIDYYPTSAEKPKSKNPIVNSMAGINNFMSLEKLITRHSIDLLLDDANLILNTNNVADSLSVANVQGSVELLNFKKGIMKTKALVVNMDNASFDGASKQFLFDKVIIYDHQQNFNINARNVKLDSLVFTDSLNMLTGQGISWEKAHVEINLLQPGKKADDPMIILFNKIQGNNTQLYINNAKSSLSVFLNTLSIASIDKKEKLKINALKTDGKDLYWFGQHTSLTADKFSLTDNSASSLTNFQFKQVKDRDSVDIKASDIVFTPDVNRIIKRSSQIKNAKIIDPVIKLRFTEKKDSSREASLPEIFVDKLEMEHPIFSMENTASKGIQKVYWDGSKSNVSLKNFTSKGIDNTISIGSFNTTLSNFSITNADNKTTTSKEGSLKIQLSDMVVNSGKKLFWSAKVNEVVAKNFTADSLGKKPATVKLYEGVLKNLQLGSEINGDLKAIIKKNPSFTISDISGEIIDEKNYWAWSNLSFSKPGQSLSVDSVSFHPVKSRDEFVSASKWQTDYITLKTGKVSVAKFDLDQYLEDSVFRSGNITIDEPYFTSYRDKTPPFHAGIIKPLATKLIQKIPFKVSIDTILISNGTAVYTELNDKTKETADVLITKMNGDIFPIKNFGLTPTDSLRIRLNFYILDSGWVRLRTRESYLDTLSGFLITLRMQPHSMLYLNKILPALSSVKLQSGYLDTLTMRAVGQDYLSLGEMRMYYHDLKVQFLKNGKEEKKRFLQGLMTFIANSFVIKKENKKRVGVVYFPRLRDRSFINYFIKIAMSGVASSVGAKKNKRLMKRYNKQIKVRQLPPIDFD